MNPKLLFSLLILIGIGFIKATKAQSAALLEFKGDSGTFTLLAPDNSLYNGNGPKQFPLDEQYGDYTVTVDGLYYEVTVNTDYYRVITSDAENVFEFFNTSVYTFIRNGTFRLVEGVTPVELTSFAAALKTDNTILLKRETATEVNNYGFEIERQNSSLSVEADPRNQNSEETWQKIGFVDGAGNSNSPKSYSYIDDEKWNGTYQYRLKQIDIDGQFKYSDIVEIELNSVPTKFSLSQNYPNPFNPATVIRYSIPNENSFVTLKIYDLLGNEAATLVSKKQSAGNYQVGFNGSQFASGVYIYRLQTSNGFVATKKLMLLK